MTEYGNVALVEEREILEGGHVTIKLPGVRKGDMASRSFKPEVSKTIAIILFNLLNYFTTINLIGQSIFVAILSNRSSLGGCNNGRFIGLFFDSWINV